MMLFKEINKIIARIGCGSWFPLAMLIFLGTIVESFSIGLVIPFMLIMLKGNSIHSSRFLQWTMKRTGSLTDIQVLSCMLIVLLTAFFIKSAYLQFVNKKQNKFVFEIEAKASEMLFAGYLHQPYTFFLQHNSAHLVKNIYYETKQLSNVINQLLNSLAEILILSLLSFILFLYQPLITTIIFCFFGVFMLVFVLYTREKNIKWGTERKQIDEQRIKQLSDAFNSIKDIKLYGREAFFDKRYKLKNIPATQASVKHLIFLKAPTLWLEFFSVCGLCLLVTLMLQRGSGMVEMLTVIGLFAAVTFRVLPSINRLSTAYQTIRFHSPVISSIWRELSGVENIGQPGMVPTERSLFHHTVAFKQVAFSYGPDTNNIIDEMSFDIQKGEYIGITGASGAGKSTIIDLLICLLYPHKGELLIDRHTIKNPRDWQNEIGYVSQTINLTDDSIKNNIAFGIENCDIDMRKLDAAIKAAQLVSFVDSLTDGADTLVGEKGVRISGGQRQRIGIARALYHEPSVLVFDEATNSLDTDTEHDIMRSIAALKNSRTIIFVTHKQELLADCDKIYRVSNGRLILQSANRLHERV